MDLHVTRAKEAVIPTATMADIAFLLIIFFMLTMTYEVDKTQVTLPETVVRMEIPKKAAYVSVNEAGLIRVSSGEEISSPVGNADEVLTFAAGVLQADPGKEFVVKADAGVPYSAIDEVIDALKRAQVRVIYLLSSAEGDAAGGGAPAESGQEA